MIQDSNYQIAIFDWVKYGQGNAVVNAVAGSGKTTTLVKSLNYMNGSVQFVAFNKSIAEDVARRVPPNVKSSTTNAFGYAVVKKAMPKIKFDKWKTWTHLAKRIKDSKLQKKIGMSVSRAVSLIKANYDGTKFPSLADLLQEHDIFFPSDVTDPHGLVIEVATACITDTSSMDFDDQILFPVYYKLNVPVFDWVCVDEGQDMNAVQHALIQMMVGGRLLAVGDPFQSIYHFRGADLDSMGVLQREFNATSLPLSICYRCAKEIVLEARQLVPHIEEWDQSPDGIVCEKNILEWKPRQGEVVLCRTNAPLIKECFRLINAGGKGYVVGKEIADNLLAMLKDIGQVADPDKMVERIEQYRALNLPRKRTPEARMQLNDSLDALVALAPSRDVAKAISNVFKEESHSVIFSTVHKAKGKEWEYVSILRPDLMPHPKAANVQQEKNIEYVAITRAKYQLTRVKGAR